MSVEICLVAQIGETAGAAWKALAENGPMSMARLVKAVGQPRDTVMMAVGWLARENKVVIEDQGRSRMIWLS